MSDTTAAAPAFRMLARGFCVWRQPRTHPMSRPIFADVALCRGRTIAQWWSDGYGERVMFAAELPPAEQIPDDHPEIDRNLIAGAQGRDFAGEIRRTLAPCDAAYWRLEPAPPTEAERFAAGTVWYPQSLWKQWLIDQDYLRGLVARHVSGDWGRHGMDAAEQLDAADRWQLPLLSIERQNRAAIRSHSGAVRSRYPIDGPPLDRIRLKRPAWQQATHYIDITTAFATGPVTIMAFATE